MLEPGKSLTERSARLQLPIATLASLGITLVITSLQWFYPALLPALDRNPAALRAGQWWRLITPRFVQPEIWPQYMLLASLAVVGPWVEWRVGSLGWLMLWLAGGLAGEGVSLAWQPQGAGASLGLFGLIGAWLVLLLWGEAAGPWWVAAIVFALLTNLLGLVVSTPLVAAVAAALVATLLSQLGQRARLWSRLAPYLAGAGLLSGLIFSGLHDQHGPPLLVGVGLAALLLALT